MMTDRPKKLIAFLLIFSFIIYTICIYFNFSQTNVRISAPAQEGKLVWQQYGCNSCHQVYGLGGYLGPDLTNVYSKGGSGYIKAFLKSGTEVMPKFQLTENEINNLAAYLKVVDSSGKSSPHLFKINYDGTIQQ